MMKYALLSYTPRRFWRRSTFEEQDTSRRILGFKDGRNVYTRWAARSMARTVAMMDLKDAAVVCIPASTRCAHVRRWKRFSQLLCWMTGASDGFEHVTVSGSRKRAHVTGEYELCTNIKRYIRIDEAFFRGRDVVVVDDIYTTGQSSSAFIDAMKAAGANVVLALFLAKTRMAR